jgi:Kef-type K+ transport system membrane component KefB
MLLFVITRAIVFGGLRHYAGFSMEIGALLAGVTLASSRYRFHVFSELRPLRDFFLALFFVYLGGQVVFDNIGLMILPIVLLSLFVLIGNPIIIGWIMMKLGYSSKDSFMTGLTVAQISEFSFIVVGMALTSGLLEDSAILSLVTVIGLITMTGSSYMFTYADRIFVWLAPLIKKYQKTNSHQTPTSIAP